MISAQIIYGLFYCRSSYTIFLPDLTQVIVERSIQDFYLFSNKVPRRSLRLCYSVIVHRTFENNEPLFSKHNLDCEDSTVYS